MRFVFCCLALSVCWLCSPRLDAQAYIVTEEQIKRLETILTEYKTSNERQKAELQELKTAAAALRTESTELNQQLTKSKESLAKEIQSTEILKENWRAYETEKSKEIATLERKNHELNKKIAFIRGFLVASSIVIVGLSIALFFRYLKNGLSDFSKVGMFVTQEEPRKQILLNLS